MEKDEKTKLKYEALNDMVRSQYQAMYQCCLGHIIDEVSMLSNELFLIISMRMSEIFNAPDKEFGGLPIIVFGDLLQLEPVQADPPFVTIKGYRAAALTDGMPVDSNLWKGFSYGELTHCHRQDGEENKRWRDLLGRLRMGNITHEDIHVLNARKIKPSITSPFLDDVLNAFIQSEERGEEPICLLPKKNLVQVFNQAIIAVKQLETRAIRAQDNYMGSGSLLEKAKEKVAKIEDDSRLTGGLETLLLLSKGARVMLTQNLALSRGLVNVG